MGPGSACTSHLRGVGASTGVLALGALLLEVPRELCDDATWLRVIFELVRGELRVWSNCKTGSLR